MSDIVERLRDMQSKKYRSDWSHWVQVQCTEAANEIERLCLTVQRLQFSLADTEALEIGTSSRLDSKQSEIESLRQQLAEAQQEIADRKADCETGHDQDEATIAELRQQLKDVTDHYHAALAAEQVRFQQLAASQAREQQLRDLLPARIPNGFVSLGKNYAEAEDKFNDPYNPMCKFKRIYLDDCEKALAMTDTSALSAIVTKAGEVMRERCAEYMLLERKAFEQNKAVWDTSPEFRPDESYIETREDRARDGEFDAKAIRALPGVMLEDIE